MYRILATTILLFACIAILRAQPFPEVFAGTWRDTTYSIFEHWEKVGDKQLKGYSYEIKNGEKVISEYIEITMKENKMVYTVSLKNQNNEKPVDFVLSATDTVYTFVNPGHDFPNYIRYKIMSPNYLQATVGNTSRRFVLNYHRID